jgi:hypothetical protein
MKTPYLEGHKGGKFPGFSEEHSLGRAAIHHEGRTAEFDLTEIECETPKNREGS